MTDEQQHQCDRCSFTPAIFPHTYENDYGETIKAILCQRCDHDIINGGEMIVDEGELALQREEQDYVDDPVNVPRPAWMG